MCEPGGGEKPVHEVVRLTLQPGETLEGYGYEPDDILDSVDATYSGPNGTQTQYCIRVWVLNKRSVNTEADQ